MQEQKYKNDGYITLTTGGGRRRHIKARDIVEVLQGTDGCAVYSRASVPAVFCKETDEEVMSLLHHPDMRELLVPMAKREDHNIVKCRKERHPKKVYCVACLPVGKPEEWLNWTTDTEAAQS